ncbi:MAG: endolytic transglycosylase MltG [Sandaracinus sp.]
MARRPRTVGRGARPLLAVVAGALALLSWLLIWYPSRRGGGRGREVDVEIAAGTTLDALAAQLAEARVIEHPAAFAIYARLLGAEGRLRTGEIVLADDMTPRTVLMRVAEGMGRPLVDVMIPEGLTRFEVAARLEHWGICEADAFLDASSSAELVRTLDVPASTAEGYLFPDTYELQVGQDPEEIVERMVSRWRVTARPEIENGLATLADLRTESGEPWGIHEVVTLASIVEEEAAVSEERPIIAGVFLNRLRSDTFLPRHRLQADPTVSYGCRQEPALAPSCAGFDGRHITRAMLDDAANRYNSYRHEGLPPGAVSSPGMASIRAVLHPAVHDYLYFVARGGRRHQFSAEYGTHLDGVDALRERERAAAAAP